MDYFDSIHMPYSCRQVYELVADIERYPEFLPGWKHARIVERHDNRLYAEQQLQTGPAVFRFHTTAQLEPCTGIHISADDGPFSRLAIDWCFVPDDREQCKVTLEMKMAMRPGLRNSALKLLLETGSSQLLPLFKERAGKLYSQQI